MRFKPDTIEGDGTAELVADSGGPRLDALAVWNPLSWALAHGSSLVRHVESPVSILSHAGLPASAPIQTQFTRILGTETVPADRRTYSGASSGGSYATAVSSLHQPSPRCSPVNPLGGGGSAGALCRRLKQLEVVRDGAQSPCALLGLATVRCLSLLQVPACFVQVWLHRGRGGGACLPGADGRVGLDQLGSEAVPLFLPP